MSHFIYKIWSEKGDMVYYGSTSNKRGAIQRYQGHLSEYKTRPMKMQCSSKLLFDSYGIENCLFQILEECESVEYKYRRERWYIENNICVNRILPAPTKEEVKESKKKYQANHKEHKKNYDEEYREKNKDKINEKIICECGGLYLIRHISTHNKTKKHQTYLNQLNSFTPVCTVEATSAIQVQQDIQSLSC
jgi:hypothetical protein